MEERTRHRLHRLPTGPPRKAARSVLGAILHQRCPRCRRGLVFRGRFAMNNLCPVCAMKFEREPGYFVGAMYVSYAMAALLLGILTFIISLIWPELPLHTMLLLALAFFLPLVPPVFRYSRVIWITIDRALDPAD
jgi:uncharacterized protein (DUF983 family)